jgi:hypothetical protein
MSLAEVVITNAVSIPRGAAASFVLGALAGLFLQCLVRLGAPSRALAVGRVILGLGAASAAWVFGLVAAPWLSLDLSCVGSFLLAVALVSGSALVKAARRKPPTDALWLWLVHGLGFLLFLGLGIATLLTAGYLSLTQDRPVLLVDVTGETRGRVVHWAPPDAEARADSLTTHHVLFRRPTGEVVAEAWLYGDEVAVKGKVLRFSPVLNAAGLPNLFELTFAHNGYATAERHNGMPHEAVALPPLGPLAVHPFWRPVQARLLGDWQTRLDPDGTWGLRASTIESTYFPLVDPDGKPVSRTFRLVLTPGGLTSS